MTDRILTKLKISSKRLLGKCVYAYTYLNQKVKKAFQTPKSSRRHTKSSLRKMKKWKSVSLVVALIICFYYGLGALISSKIYNRLDIETNVNARKGQNIVSSLAYVIKTQVDEQAWTPALPPIFPAAILDNLPNFQLGVKESANFFIKKVAKRYNDENLKKAGQLLDYDADIWLFSQNKEDKLSPGSAKQYRKALAHIEKSLKQQKNASELLTDENFLYLLKSVNKYLNNKINFLNSYIQEHNSEVLDLKADDVFYNTQGVIYTLHYMLTALSKDYQHQILAAEQYEEITSVLKFLTQASELSPIGIKNASPNDLYEANHLIYLAYYLTQAQNRSQKIYYEVLLKSIKDKKTEEASSSTENENEN